MTLLTSKAAEMVRIKATFLSLVLFSRINSVTKPIQCQTEALIGKRVQKWPLLFTF